MPSDYRYNPFLNSLEPIAITGEIHVIPTNSPFTIRLHEVPLKEAPSTVSLTIGGVAGVEVAAEPALGEFRCDYTTGADQDDNWNTGLIQFNAADAGKKVIVSYKGMGTLASINAAKSNPDWFYDRGDGSDGDFNPTSNVTISGVKNYRSVNIPAGITVTVGAEPLYIKCQTLCNIAGTINGKGKGQLFSSESNSVGGSGYGKNPNRTSGISLAGSSLGSGGSCSAGNYSLFDGLYVALNGATPSSTYQKIMSLSNACCAGSAGAYIESDVSSAYGGGAGTLRVVANNIINTGTISVLGGKAGNGNSNNQYCMPSGGASIIIVANDFYMSGSINIDGGDALNSTNGARTASGWYTLTEVGNK